MICPNCGNDLPDGMTLCRNCAAVVHKKTVYIKKKQAESGCQKVLNISGTAPIRLDIRAGVINGTKLIVKNAVFTYPDGKQKKELVIVTVRIGMHRALKAFLWLYAAAVLFISAYMIGKQAKQGNIPFLNKATTITYDETTEEGRDLLDAIGEIVAPSEQSALPKNNIGDDAEEESPLPEETTQSGLPYGSIQMQIYSDFLSALQMTLPSTDVRFNHYVLYDLNDDFMPELVIRTGNSDDTAIYSVYTIKEEIVVKLGQLPFANSSLYTAKGHDQLFLVSSEDGEETVGAIDIEDGVYLLAIEPDRDSLTEVVYYAIEDHSTGADSALDWKGNPYYS
ncbi:MAG: zinc ribbon domain-containing protein [Christensenellaceae bacterium]|nr:zinc ribbon domain-containing protein [Christensenellaceae bacterium]